MPLFSGKPFVYFHQRRLKVDNSSISLLTCFSSAVAGEWFKRNKHSGRHNLPLPGCIFIHLFGNRWVTVLVMVPWDSISQSSLQQDTVTSQRIKGFTLDSLPPSLATPNWILESSHLRVTYHSNCDYRRWSKMARYLAHRPHIKVWCKRRGSHSVKKFP